MIVINQSLWIQNEGSKHDSFVINQSYNGEYCKTPEQDQVMRSIKELSLLENHVSDSNLSKKYSIYFNKKTKEFLLNSIFESDDLDKQKKIIPYSFYYKDDNLDNFVKDLKKNLDIYIKESGNKRRVNEKELESVVNSAKKSIFESKSPINKVPSSTDIVDSINKNRLKILLLGGATAIVVSFKDKIIDCLFPNKEKTEQTIDEDQEQQKNNSEHKKDKNHE